MRPFAGHRRNFPRLSPLRQVLIPWALGENRGAVAHRFAKLTPEELSALWEEASRFGLTSLAEAILGVADVDGYQMARKRVESFKAAHHAQKTWEIAHKLTQAGIDTIVLKGAPLSEDLYEVENVHFWMRPSQDIDLFVSPKAVFEASEILHEAGYVPKSPEKFHRARAQNAVRHALDFIPLKSTGITQFSIDLHTHLSHSPWRENLEFPALFEHSVPFKNLLKNQSLREKTGLSESTQQPRKLSPLDEAIFLASHGTGHRFYNPKWALDVARAWCRLLEAGVTENEVVARAKDCRCAGALSFALDYLKASFLEETPGALSKLSISLENGHWSSFRRKIFALSLALPEDSSSYLFPIRGGLTCLSLVDHIHPSIVSPLMKLALEKLAFAKEK